MIRTLSILWISTTLVLSAGGQTNSIGMKLAPIRPGEFVMGQTGVREESPAHPVTITRPFALAATEVTRGQWKTVMGAEPPDLGLKDQTDQHPVVGVTWFEAVEFCKQLSAKEGQTYRLPTEAEWEYACRAGTTTAYSFGPKPDLATMVCEADPRERNQPLLRTRSGPVVAGSTPANAWGLHEMHGNVHEWCYDFFHGESYVETLITRFMDSLPEAERAQWANPQKDASGYGFRPDCPTGEETERKITPRLAKALEAPLMDPLGPARGQADQRVIRGGGWGQPAVHCRSASRFGADPLWRNQAIGFRVLCETASPGLAVAMVFPAAPGTVDGRPEVVVTPAGQRFILVKPGSFQMGISPDEAAAIKAGNISTAFAATPMKKITFTKPFYLASTMYPKCVTMMAGLSGSYGSWVPTVADLPQRGERTPNVHPWPYECDRPDTAPWYDAVDRILVMSLHDGRSYRLPNLAEMEYATRAGTTTAWYWGNDASRYFDYECLRGPGPSGGDGDQPRHVGRKLPNPWGFYDTLCNSTQWTSTPFDAPPPDGATDPVGDPIGKPATAATIYARRAVGYRYQMGVCGSSSLDRKFGNYRNCTRVGGFRLAFDADQVSTRPVDAAWRQQILELRVANFVAGGDYGLTWLARTKINTGTNGEEGYGAQAIEYYRRVLSIDPVNQAARAGLNRVKAELLPMWREKCAGNAPALAAIAQNEKQVDELLAARP
jgi:formylglycine-generating enzyme required for sulfatase activity